MRRVAALLAAALLLGALVGCGGGGAEPGAPKGATLVLDFQPNAVHAGIYAAQANGYFKDAGIDLHIQEPSSTADAPKLLETGRADFAIMDINDFGIARERGLDLVGDRRHRPAPARLGDRPRPEPRSGPPPTSPARRSASTGVPSDDAVLDSVLRSGGVDPSDVHSVTIGFNAVADLAAGKVDAATAFWNAEGVELQQRGIPIREFRVDQFGAPRYPELHRRGASRFLPGHRRLSARPETGLLLPREPLLRSVVRPPRAVQGLDAGSERAQFKSLGSAGAFAPTPGHFPVSTLPVAHAKDWLSWATQHGVIDHSSAQRVEPGFDPAVCG